MIELDVPSKNNKKARTYVWGAFMCVFFTLSALFLFFVTIDNIDVDGSITNEFLQYESIINFYCLLGLFSVPLGMILGIAGCITCRNDNSLRGLAIVPIVIQGLFLSLYLHNIIAYSHWNSRVPPIPVAIPLIDNSEQLP